MLSNCRLKASRFFRFSSGEDFGASPVRSMSRTGLPVILWDERLTTVAADRLMIEAGIRRENRKEYVDKIAAAMILQGYLDRRSMQEAQRSQE